MKAKHITYKNIIQAFHVIRKLAGVDEYRDTVHSMRKNRAQEWPTKIRVAPRYLQEYMGHSKVETTMKYYLKVSESEFRRISETSFFSKTVQISEEKEFKKII